MKAYIPITYLNDFVFCPYSVYLHQVFDNNTEDLYSANPQQVGKTAHADIDDFKEEKPEVIKGCYVISNKLGVYGKIDTYYVNLERLVESKYEIKTLYRGYYYQIWCHYFALTEMGFKVKELQFYAIKNNKIYPIPIPTKADYEELRAHIKKIAWFDFEQKINVNPAKCKHCIYAALCDKTQHEHVYA